ncbi:MAG: hypothetical protein JWN76_3084 [Chitinophagaceae bacterium]|nr:hypothetical protein [Chitinophagaceae bacterium]
MKKIVLIGVLAASLAACNNGDSAVDNKKDSLDSIAKEQKSIIDSTAEKKEDKIDSLTDKKKDALDRQDSIRNHKDTAKHK